MFNPVAVERIKVLLMQELEEADFEPQSDGTMLCRDSNRTFDLSVIMKRISDVLDEET